MMNIQWLKWDSDFFGIKIGKIEILDGENFDPVKFKLQASEEKYELIYVFKFGKRLSLPVITDLNIELVDIMVTMSMKLDKKNITDFPYDFREALSLDELIDCHRIAEEISVVSRFFNEPGIGAEKTKHLYRKWVDNALNKTISDGLFIHKAGNAVVGIHLIKTDHVNQTGLSTLIGVNPDIKGKGIGSNLWKQALAYWTSTGKIEKVKSPFSMQNIESFNFHLKTGFNKIEEIKYIYHYRTNV